MSAGNFSPSEYATGLALHITGSFAVEKGKLDSFWALNDKLGDCGEKWCKLSIMPCIMSIDSVSYDSLILFNFL